MSKIQYTTVDRVLSRLDRELSSNDISEDDAIEWIGEALDFLKMPEIQEEAVCIASVQDFQVQIPEGFHAVLQVARFDDDQCKSEKECCGEPEESLEDLYEKLKGEQQVEIKPNDCQPIIDILYSGYEAKYRPYFDMQWQYSDWIVSKPYQRNFTPVRLANRTLYKSLVCEELTTPYCEDSDEYTIVGTVDKAFRFSFNEGMVAISYLRSAVDTETGYPLIPDVIQHITAITYYIKWKYAERLSWDGREGFARLAADSERLWLKYVKQAKNWTKMPKDIDDLQDLLEETHNLIPRHNRYYNFFGKLGRPESRKYANPDNRLRFYKQ